jgi:hypothetical protein
VSQIWCVDLDDCISSTPDAMRTLMEGLRSQGIEVHVVSGIRDGPATPEHLKAKKALLEQLGCGDSYDKLVAVSGPEDEVAAGKVNYMQHVGSSTLVDNDKRNVKAARKAGFLAFRHMDPK